MALTDNGNELVMPVGPLYGNNGGGFGFGGDFGSLVVLFLIAGMFGGFGNGWGSMGRYSRRGYSEADHRELVEELRDIMDGADQTMKKEFEHFINKIEQM